MSFFRGLNIQIFGFGGILEMIGPETVAQACLLSVRHEVPCCTIRAWP